MSDLTAANLSRLNAALDKKYRFPDGVATYRAMIESGLFSRGEIGEVASVQYNRRKWNRMDCDQQREYQRKLDTTKPEYRLYCKDEADTYHTVPKMIFDWFETRGATVG